MNQFCLTEKLILAVVVMASLLAMSPSIAEVDLWGHVQYGRDVLKTGSLPTTTTYSFTASGFPWINHENIPEIVLAWTADNLGNVGLLAGKCLLALFIVISILWFNLRNGVGVFAASAVTLLVAANLGFHFSLRPQVASFVCFVMLLLVLQSSFAGWRDRWLMTWPRFGKIRNKREGLSVVADQTDNSHNQSGLASSLGYSSARLRLLWIVPVIFALWGNAHGGFPAGLFVYWAYLGCRTLEAWYQCGRQASGLTRRFALMATAAGLATFLTPYSYHLHTWLWEAVGNPCPEISDWCMDELFTITGLKFWILLGVAIFAFSNSRNSRDFTQTVLLALTLWQSILHFRHVPFFAILCGFWIGPHLQSAFERVSLRFRLPQNGLPVHGDPNARLVNWGLGVAVALLCCALGGRLTFLQVDKSKFPIDAVQYMSDNQINGRMVVTYDWAQYAIYAMCSENASGESRGLVSFDGRYRTCYPQLLCDLHFDFLFGIGPNVARYRSSKSPPCDPVRILDYGNPELVLNRRFAEQTERVMRGETENWVLLYQDAIAQVWGRRDIFDNDANPRFIPVEARQIGDRLDRSIVSWPAIPVSNSQLTTSMVGGQTIAINGR
jgi:hypothetical protein